MPDFPYAGYAKSLGLTGIRVEKPEQIGPAWDEALHAKTPAIIEFHTDPEVPPLPPHITKDQAKKFLEALMKDPARGEMIKESMKEMFASVLK